MTNYTATVRNNDNTAHTYTLGQDPITLPGASTPSSFAGPENSITLQPGQSGTLSITAPFGAGDVGVIDTPFQATWGMTNYLGTIYGSNTLGSTLGSSSPFTYNGSTTNSPIIWSAAAATNQLALEAIGFGAMTTLSAQNGAIESAQLQGLATLIAAGNTLLGDINNNTRTNGGGGGGGGTGTNIYNITGGGGGSNVWVQNWPTDWQSNTLGTLAGMSNLLAGITNGTGTGAGYSNMLALVPGTATNAAAATNAVIAIQGNYGVQGFLNELNPLVNADANGAGEPAVFTMALFGETLDFNPVAMFPSLQVMCYLGFKIVTELAFLMWLAARFWEMVRAKSAVQGGGVPDLEVNGGVEVLTFGGSFGGNFAGVAVALIVPGVFLAMFVGVMVFCFSVGLAYVPEAMNLTAWETSLGEGAFYLLTSYIPVNLIFTLAVTKIVLTYMLSFLYDVAASASRFLWMR